MKATQIRELPLIVGSLLRILPARQKVTGTLLLVAIILNSGLEAISVGLVLPLISVISAPEIINEYSIFRQFFDVLSLDPADRQTFTVVAMLFVVVFLAKTIFLGLQNYFQVRFSANIFAITSKRLLNTYMKAPYTYHLEQNSAGMIRAATSDAFALSNRLLRPGFVIISEVCVILAITVMLFAVNPIVTVGAVLAFGVLSMVIFEASRPSLTKIGQRYLRHHTAMLALAYQVLNNIKLIKVTGRDQEFLNVFSGHGELYAQNIAMSTFLENLPRLLIELFVVVGILITTLLMLSDGDAGKEMIPLLALFAAAAIRLMPSASRILGALNQMIVSLATLDSLRHDLEIAPETPAEYDTEKAIKFDDEIRLEHLSFRYSGSSVTAIENINITIPKGGRIGIVGVSGSGKSTLVDTLMGLLFPTDGRILVDGMDTREAIEQWRRKIGYVPQQVDLLDNTIKMNIAFGLPEEKINLRAVQSAVDASQLRPILHNLPDALDTVIGENGIRLSGGQRQRIAIARALYSDPDVLILDEATSALDNETEQEFTQALQELGKTKTIIVIAHRLTTVRDCDVIYLMENGRIIASGPFNELATDSERFRRMLTARSL